MKVGAFLDHVESCKSCRHPTIVPVKQAAVLCAEGKRMLEEVARAIAPMPRTPGRA